jgi:hypothetical protein
MSGMKDLFGDEPYEMRKPSHYPETPGWKEPTTSRNAARIMESVSKALQADCMRVLRQNPNGLTADEVAAVLGEDILAIRPRISELRSEKMGRLVVPSGEKRKNKSGILAMVWRARF